LLATAALGLRGTTPESLAGPVVPATFAEKKDRPPLDVSYVLPSDGKDEVGLFAIRIGELCRQPGMDKMAEMYTQLLPTLIGDRQLGFALADIDQIAGRVTITQQPDQPPPNNSLQMSLTSIRLAKDFDWPKQVREWCTDWKEHSHEKATYYSGKFSIPALGFKDTVAWFYMPDKRTVVLESEENIKKLIDHKGKPAEPVWAADWKAVEGGIFAVIIPDTKGKLAKKIPDKLGGSMIDAKPFKAICTKSARAAIGIDLADGFSIKFRFACATADDASDVDEGCQALAKLAKELSEKDNDGGDDALNKADQKLSADLLRGIEFNKTVDHVVEVRMSSKTGVAELLKSFDKK
jgi:hypothetical protein